MSSNVERKLAAIMFTDIAGYTALSAKDENKALGLLDKQEEILTPIIERFNGRLHKKIGDGLLHTFPTVTEAIKCAISIQKETRKLEDLNLRVGIHEGEVTLKDGDVLGDDVNVASRIEAFSPIGGIAISGKVQQDISSLPEFQTEFIDSPNLKGVAQEIKIYGITSHNLPKPDKTTVHAKLEKEEAKPRFNIFALTGAVLTIIGVVFWISVGVVGVSFGGKQEAPSVGIMMMENRGSSEDTFWVRGITEDLIIKVASSGNIRIPSIKEIGSVDISESWEKIADRLNVKYILTSSLYKDKGKFKLSSQLINTDTGVTEYANNWTEANDKVSTIVTTLAEQMLKIISPKAKFKKDKNIVDSESYTLYMKAKSYAGEDTKYNNTTPEELDLAQNLLENSIALDSTNVDAQIQLSRIHNYHKDVDTAIEILQKSVKICENTDQEKLLGRAYRNLGNAFMHKWRGGKGIYSEMPSLDNWRKAAKIAKKHGDIIGFTWAMGNIIGNFKIYRDSESSIDSVHLYADQMLVFAKEQNSIELEARAYLNLGSFYSNSTSHEDLSEANYYIKKAYNLSKSLSILFQIDCLSGLYQIAYSKENYYNQLDYAEEVHTIASKIKNNDELIQSLSGMAVVYSYPLSDFQKAEGLLDELLLYKNKISDFYYWESHAYREKGDIRRYQGDYQGTLAALYSRENAWGANQKSDYIVFDGDWSFGRAYFHLEEHLKAKSYFEKAITLMNLSNAVYPKHHLVTYYILNELKLGNVTSLSDTISAPLHSKWPEIRVPLGDWLSYYTAGGNGDTIDEADSRFSDLTYVHYHLYLIYQIIGNKEEAKKYIDLSYNKIMDVASKLRKKDRNNFLNKNVDISDIVAAWKQINQ